MNDEPDSSQPNPEQPPGLPIHPSAVPSPTEAWAGHYQGWKRPSVGVILGGVVMGLLGTPVVGVLVGAVVAQAFDDGMAAAFSLVTASLFLWLWSGWLTAAFARAKGARIGLALLFGLGYGIFPFAVIFAICGGRFGG